MSEVTDAMRNVPNGTLAAVVLRRLADALENGDIRLVSLENNIYEAIGQGIFSVKWEEVATR